MCEMCDILIIQMSAEMLYHDKNLREAFKIKQRPFSILQGNKNNEK